jgi:branched-chain amino acid transport system ATP-binding protein
VEVLRADRLSKDFGGVKALENISFAVEKGERLAIIGPNGAGKTTLFNLLNGQLSPDKGEVFFSGRNITRMAEFLRVHLGLARTFQLTSLFLNLTGLHNILLALHGTRSSRFQMLRSMSSYRHLLARAQDLLEMMDLWEKRDLPVKEFSYGEQRKMEIALSLASNPRLLLMDEPGNGLTAAENAVLIDTIRNLEKDITVLIVAHDMDLVFGVARRIIVLHYGRIIAEGTPDDIQEDSRVKEVYMGIED